MVTYYHYLQLGLGEGGLEQWSQIANDKSISGHEDMSWLRLTTHERNDHWGMCDRRRAVGRRSALAKILFSLPQLPPTGIIDSPLSCLSDCEWVSNGFICFAKVSEENLSICRLHVYLCILFWGQKFKVTGNEMWTSFWRIISASVVSVYVDRKSVLSNSQEQREQKGNKLHPCHCVSLYCIEWHKTHKLLKSLTLKA